MCCKLVSHRCCYKIIESDSLTKCDHNNFSLYIKKDGHVDLLLFLYAILITEYLLLRISYFCVIIKATTNDNSNS